jgi:hypothetical protein
VCGISSYGISNFNTIHEADDEGGGETWIPSYSTYTDDKKWIDEKFPNNTIRNEIVLITAEHPGQNILRAETLLGVCTITNNSVYINEIAKIKFEYHYTFQVG